MTKFKVGDSVRILKGHNTIVGATIGSVATIIGGFDGEDYKIEYQNVLGGKSEGWAPPHKIEKVSDKPTKKQRLTDAESEIATLKSQVAELTAKVEALEKAEKPTFKLSDNPECYYHGKYIGGLGDIAKTPNEQRKAIIAEAKAFVKGVNDEEFIVNRDKRTVVVLVHSASTGKVLDRAIAKCAPDDVFNADIGKAIALGRALGLDVKRFEQAVKPTEVVVGHVVSGGQEGGYYRPSRKFTLTSETGGNAFYYAEASEYHGRPSSDWIGRSQMGAIIDDTDAKY